MRPQRHLSRLEKSFADAEICSFARVHQMPEQAPLTQYHAPALDSRGALSSSPALQPYEPARMRRVALGMSGIERRTATTCPSPLAWPPPVPPAARAAPLPSLHVCTAKHAVTHAANHSGGLVPLWLHRKADRSKSTEYFQLLPVGDAVSPQRCGSSGAHLHA